MGYKSFGMEILGEETLYSQGSFKWVRRWVKGKHPHLGPLHLGLSGEWETVIEMGVVTPTITTGVEAL